MPPPGRAAALRPSTADPGQAAACPLLNPLSPGPGHPWPEIRPAQPAGARPTPHQIRGGVGLRRRKRLWRVRHGFVLSPPATPPVGGFNPPRPLPGGAEGGASLPRPAIGPPRRPASLGGSAVPAPIARPPPSWRNARPPSWRPHGPPAARRSAAAGPRRHRRTMPRSCGLSLLRSHVVFRHHIPDFLGENGRFCRILGFHRPGVFWYNDGQSGRVVRPEKAVAPRVLAAPAGPGPQASMELATHGHCSRCCAPRRRRPAPRPSRHLPPDHPHRRHGLPPPPLPARAGHPRRLGRCGSSDHDSARYIVTAPKGQPARCTCPDHERSGWTCKHIGALTAAGLIPGPSRQARTVSPPAPASCTPRMPARPSPRPRPCRRSPPPPRGDRPHPQALPEGWQPGGAHPSFAAGFRQAVAAHVARIGRGGYEICDGCGAEFDIRRSPAIPSFCSAVRERR